MFWAGPERELPGHISIERGSERIADFAKSNSNSTVVICGGVIMQNPASTFPITRQTCEAGWHCFFVVNDTMTTNEDVPDRDTIIPRGTWLAVKTWFYPSSHRNAELELLAVEWKPPLN